MWVVYADADALETSREQARATAGAGGFAYGLVIGQRKATDSRDVAVAFIPTPSQGAEARRPVTQLEHIDEGWLAQHARQVARALPGGIDVLGMYVFMPSEQSISKTAAVKLGALVGTGAVTSDLLYMCLCSTSKRTVVRTMDPSDPMRSLRAGELKTTPLSGKFQAASSQVHIDKVLVAHVMPGERVYDALVRGDLGRLLKSVDHAIIMWSPRSEVRPCKFLLVEEEPDASEGSIPEEAVVHRVHLTATLDCRAFTYNRDPAQADAHIRQDLHRTLQARLDLLADELSALEEESGRPSLLASLRTALVAGSSAQYVAPRRCFVPGPFGVSWSDYAFPEDSPNDVVDRLQTFLGLSAVNSESVISREAFPVLDRRMIEAAAAAALAPAPPKPTFVPSTSTMRPEDGAEMLPEPFDEVPVSDRTLWLTASFLVLVIALLLYRLVS